MMVSMGNLHIVLFIGVMCVVQTMAQVCPYSDPACTCSYETLTCYELQRIPAVNTGVNVSKVIRVIYISGNITSLSNNSLPSGLQSISFISNPVTNISEDAFEASAATLQGVSFASADLNSLPTALKKLTSLNLLLVFDTPIHVWDNATLTHIGSTLKTLVLHTTGLSAWPSWMSSFHLLQDLDLSFESIGHIPDNAFSSFKDSLRGLYLENIGLTHVPQALSTLSGLVNLDLRYNYFNNVTEFKQISESPVAQTLSKLQVDSTGLTRMPNLSNLTNLTSFSASNNSISDIPVGSLPVSLTQLHLSDNSLSSVPTGLARMTNLSYLDLSRNQITNIEPNSFPSSLTVLILSHNNITLITNTTFKNLVLMHRLSLDHNQISTISPSALSDLVGLQNFYIRNSHLTQIPVAFAKLNPQIKLFFSTTQSLACPCPARQELSLWFRRLEYPFQANCNNGQSVSSYLMDQCGQPSADP